LSAGQMVTLTPHRCVRFMAHLNPRILYVMSSCPYPPAAGAQIRGLGIGRLLQQCGDVRLVLLQKRELDPVALAKTQEEFAVEAVMRLTPSPIRGVCHRLRHEFDPWYLNTDGWTISVSDTRHLTRLAAAHDLVWIHGTYTANSAGFLRWRRCVMDLDDVLSNYYRSALKSSKSWKDRVLNARQIFLWKRRERILFKRFGILAVCSETDRRQLGGDQRIHVIPNGYGMTPVEPSRHPTQPPRLGFIGTPKYEPNLEGISWFIKEVWPEVKRSHPTARLRLVGSGTDRLSDMGPDIDGLGWVSDTAPEMASWSLSIVPIRVGGGTRIKTAESFSRKCPVVSTSLGVYGYDVTSGSEILLADQPGDFAKACNAILGNPALGDRLADHAWQRYTERWTWSAIKPRVEAAVEHGLRLSKGQPAAQEKIVA
jgi:polysaccharide biosynthesis protein PslH